MWLRRNELHLMPNSQVSDHLLDPPDLVVTRRSASTTNNNQSGIVTVEFGERSDRNIDALERLNTTNEQHMWTGAKL